MPAHLAPARSRLAASVGALLTVAACAAPTAPAGPAEAPVEGFPVTITHAFGVTSVPAPPTRIVALGKNDAEAAVVLGIPLVATSSGLDVYPWLQSALDAAGSTALSDETGTPLEQVAALEPDLIIAMDVVDAAEYESLSALAPTLTYEEGRFGYSWQEFTRYVATATGRTAEAEEVIAETEGRVAELVAAHPAIADRTFSLSNLSADFPFVIYADESPGVQFFTDLGMRRSPELDRMASGEVTLVDDYLSLEQLNLLDADVVVTSFGTPEDRDFFAANRIFAGMDASSRGAVVELDTATIGQVLLPSALGNVEVLEALVPELERAALTVTD